MEQSRLNYLLKNQEYIRADLYQNVINNLNQSINLGKTGNKVVLPSTFVGGPR